MTAVIRADQVGSLLHAAELLQARRDYHCRGGDVVAIRLAPALSWPAFVEAIASAADCLFAAAAARRSAR